jgi:hypothetical protein
MKSLRFPVKGVSGLSLIFSEAFGVVVAMVSAMVAMVSAMVSSVSVLVSRCQVCQVLSSQGLEGSVYQSIKVLWCQGVGVHCKDTGVFVGESTLLLDFRMLKTKRSTVCTLVSVAKRFASKRRKKLCITSNRLQSVD